MKTEYFKISSCFPEEERINHVVEILSNGGLVVLPTETVYGIGFDLESDIALNKIRVVKRERDAKPYTVCIPDLSWLDNYDIEEKSRKNFSLIEDLIPGPITAVMAVKGKDKLGFRIPANDITRQVVYAFSKPIGLSSANFSYQMPARGAQEAMDYLWGAVDLIIDGGSSVFCVPSLVLDLSLNPVEILRTGPPFVTEEVKKRLMVS